MLNIKEGCYVKLRNGDVCGPITKHTHPNFVWKEKYSTNTCNIWTGGGTYFIGETSEKDIIEIVPNPNIDINDDVKYIQTFGRADRLHDENPPINRINRQDVNNFRDKNYVGNALNEYQRIATQSAIYPGRKTPFGLMYVALGLAEAGEVQNKVKKAFRDDNLITIKAKWDDGSAKAVSASYDQISPERRAQIIKELGDALWYISAVCDEIDATLSEVAIQNLEELCSRGERGTLQGDGDNR